MNWKCKLCAKHWSSDVSYISLKSSSLLKHNKFIDDTSGANIGRCLTSLISANRLLPFCFGGNFGLGYAINECVVIWCWYTSVDQEDIVLKESTKFENRYSLWERSTLMILLAPILADVDLRQCNEWIVITCFYTFATRDIVLVEKIFICEYQV